jgi:hypothetical protein
MNTIGALLVGGAGVTAGLRDDNRDGFGLVSSVLGLFGLWASQRHDSRLKVQLCASDPENSAIDSLRHPFVLDSSGRISSGLHRKDKRGDRHGEYHAARGSLEAEAVGRLGDGVRTHGAWVGAEV